MAPIDLRWAARATLAVARRPALWGTGLRQVRVLARPRWWRRRPHLPLPDEGYLRFRLETAYGGGGDRAPDVADLVTYLRWVKDLPPGARPGRRRLNRRAGGPGQQ